MKAFLIGIFSDAKKRRGIFVIGILLLIIGLLFDYQIKTFLYSQRDYVLLNTSMRDAQRVRDDCKILIKRRELLRFKKWGMELHLSKEELPVSLVRLGAKKAIVSADAVLICLYYDDWSGGAWGFLYDPHRSDHINIGRYYYLVRDTWYRDFYEARISGE